MPFTAADRGICYPGGAEEAQRITRKASVGSTFGDRMTTPKWKSETFYVDFRLEHLRQHERITNADWIVHDEAQRFHMTGTPKVTPLAEQSKAQ
jgi:hypothetical protein